MRICIVVHAPQKGLLASLGKALQARGHAVVFAVEDRDTGSVIRSHFENLGADDLFVINEAGGAISIDLVSECLHREAKFGETFAMMVAHDRGLGKGYLLNVQAHPSVGKAWWSRDEKYREVLAEFLRCETAIERLRPDLVISVGVLKSMHLVCRAAKIPVRILTPPRFGSLYRWTVNEYEDCPTLDRAVDQRIAAFAEAESLPSTELEQTSFAQHFFASFKYDYFTALVNVAKRVVVESIQMVRLTHKQFRGSYTYLGWCGPDLRRPYIYRYLMRYGVTPENVGGNRLVLFPLHVEPEASLLNLSPELNNSLELISWVSKCLPANALLVVKEHPDSFGMRPRDFYDNLRRMANVVVAHPGVTAKAWLAKCDLLANLTSTMGFEAVAMNKPVLSFGAHQVINRLPSVEYADSFAATRTAIQRLLDPGFGKSRAVQVSRAALDKAFKDVCFDLSGYEAIFASNELHMDLARAALDNLALEFPVLADTNRP
jgi:hypothetical protein